MLMLSKERLCLVLATSKERLGLGLLCLVLAGLLFVKRFPPPLVWSGLCGEKLNQRLRMWRKNDTYEV